eukprot:435326-Karenia_brevis.AAC.1
MYLGWQPVQHSLPATCIIKSDCAECLISSGSVAAYIKDSCKLGKLVGMMPQQLKHEGHSKLRAWMAAIC